MLGEDDEYETNPPTGSDPTNQPRPTPTGGAPQGAPTEPRSPDEGVHQVKHSDFKRIKAEAEEKGRRRALDDLDAKARDVGFTSLTDALQKWSDVIRKPEQSPAKPADTQVKPKEPQPMPKPSQTNQPKNEEALRREALRKEDERQKMRKQWRTAETRRRELERQLDASKAEMALREELFRSGVKDVDYAIRLMTRELEGKTVEEIAKYDRKAFTDRLRSDKPYLFGETVTPATTGADPARPAGDAGPAPATPAPGAANAGEAERNKFDARKAKPEEVAQRLRELGLNPQL